MGKIKERNRGSKKRHQKPVVYIVCEGNQTEPKYFANFRTRYCHVEVITCKSQYKDASTLVRKATSSLGKHEYHPKYGDTIWCVFDRDDNDNIELQKAEQLARKLDYKIIYSNPCFELWFLNHFINHTSYLENSEAVIHELKKADRIPGYAKSTDYFNLLLSKQEDAIQNSEKGLQRMKRNGYKFLTRESNPVTNVHELVQFLKNATK